MLDRLAEMAMEQAEAMHRATMAAVQADDAARAKEYGLAFDRAGRAVRHMLALKLHLARKRQEMAEKAAVHARDSAAAKETRRFRVARAIACSVAANRDLDAETCEAQIAAMWRRLVDDPGIDADLSRSGHALEEIVFHLCRDMGIRPDPAWINPDYSGADWFGRRKKPKDGEDKPPALGGRRKARTPPATGISTKATRSRSRAGTTSKPANASTAPPGCSSPAAADPPTAHARLPFPTRPSHTPPPLAGGDKGEGSARVRRQAAAPGVFSDGLTAWGPARPWNSRRSRAWSCGRASRPRRISPAADKAGTCCRPARRRARS